MSFTDTQLRKLRARLNPDRVKSRVADGQILSYLEGWYVIAEANRIFGFDGWDRETLSSTCVYSKQIGDRYCATYAARVRISVRAGERTIIREGSGAGEANVTSPGQAHEIAAKAAETDATKRALMTFGNPFGLSLYRGALDPAELVAKPAAVPKTPKGMDVHDRQPERPAPVSMAQSGTVEVAAQATGAPHNGSEEPPRGGDVVQAVTPEPVSIRATGIPDPIGVADLRLAGPVRSPAAVDKSVLAISEPRRIRDADHLRFVASQPCVVCGRLPAQAHHLKFTQAPAMSRKVSDEFTVPLCALHHRELHDAGNERAWWERKKLDPEVLARALWLSSQGRPAETPSTPAEALLNGSIRGW